MSVDPKVVLEISAHPVDVKALRILRMGSAIDFSPPMSDQESFVKSKVFIKCLIKLFSTCGSKYKNYLTQHEKELEKSVQRLIDDVGDFVIRSVKAHPDDCEELIKSVMSLMNSPSPSFPKLIQKSMTECWLRMTDPAVTAVFIGTLLRQASATIVCPFWVCDVFEDCLESFFNEEEIRRSKPRWSEILPFIQLPAEKEKYQQCLERAVKEGHCLILFASLRISRSKCTSMGDERALISTLIDWFRHLELSEKSEPKIPLLYRETVALCDRQLACGAPHPVVVKILLEFCDALAPLLGLDGGSWNILGALGFSSKYNPPPRAKLLALALTYFIQKNLLQGPKIKLKNCQEEALCLDSERVSKIEEDMRSLLKKQSFFGLSEIIEWILKVMNDSSCFEDGEAFLSYIICDNLYADRYHHIA